MRRLIVSALVAGLMLVPVAAPAAGAPRNKNVTPVQATCDGKQYTVLSPDKANVNGAFHVVGVGPGKLISLTAFEPGTTNVLFTDQSNYPKEPNVTCTGTFNATDPSTGQQFSFDFQVQAYVRGL